MAKKIRIKDIAQKAKVSTGTVDRVLHNRGNVSAEKRARVEAVMDELGYEPNIIARTLASNRIVRIAILLPLPAIDPYWAAPVKGVDKAWQSVRHYGVEADIYYFNLFHQENFTEKANEALSKKVDGLVFPPVFLKAANQLLAKCQERGIPVSIFNTELENSSILTYVGQNSYQSGVLAGKLLSLNLIETGKVVIVNLSKEPANAKHLTDKEQGLLDYFAKAGIGDEKRILRFISEDFDHLPLLEKQLRNFLRNEPTLRGMFVTNSRAYRILQALPADLLSGIRIVGFDLLPENIEFLREGRIDFLINQNPVEQGYMALMSLVNKLIFDKEVPLIQHLPLDIVVAENAKYYLKREESYALTV
mgnify:CR=1 FL=1